MKKILIISTLALFLCFTIIPTKAYAADFSGGAQFGKTRTYTTSTSTGTQDNWHKTTDSHSVTRGGFVYGSARGVTDNQMNQMSNFYRNDIKPFIKHHAKRQPVHRSSFRSQQSFNSGFNPPSFNQPSFNTPNMGGFNPPSAPHFGF